MMKNGFHFGSNIILMKVSHNLNPKRDQTLKLGILALTGWNWHA